MSEVAARYAKAILELGTEQNCLPQVSQQLDSIASLYLSHEVLRTSLDNPVVSEEKRMAILEAVADRLDIRGLCYNALRLIAYRRRLALLPEISVELGRMADESRGLVRVQLSSAVKLDATYVAELKAALEEQSRREVLIESREDPSLIVGLSLTIGDNTFDGSVQARLQELERELTQA